MTGSFIHQQIYITTLSIEARKLINVGIHLMTMGVEWTPTLCTLAHVIRTQCGHMCGSLRGRVKYGALCFCKETKDSEPMQPEQKCRRKETRERVRGGYLAHSNHRRRLEQAAVDWSLPFGSRQTKHSSLRRSPGGKDAYRIRTSVRIFHQISSNWMFAGCTRYLVKVQYDSSRRDFVMWNV